MPKQQKTPPPPPPILSPRQLAEMFGPERAQAILERRQRTQAWLDDPAIQASLARPYEDITQVGCMRTGVMGMPIKTFLKTSK